MSRGPRLRCRGPIVEPGRPQSRQRRARGGRPAARAQRPARATRPGRRDVELDHADRLAGRVVDPDVLDVDRCRRGVGEQPGERARRVRHHHGHRRPAHRLAGRACRRAGPDPPGPASSSAATAASTSAAMAASSVATSAASGSTTSREGGGDRGRVRRHDLGPQRGVGVGEPRGVPQPGAGERHLALEASPTSEPASAEATSCGTWDSRASSASWSAAHITVTTRAARLRERGHRCDGAAAE